MDYSNLIIQEGVFNDKEYIYNGINNLKVSLLNFGNVSYKNLKVYIIIKGFIRIIDVNTNLDFLVKDKNIVVDIEKIEPTLYNNVIIKIQEIGYSNWNYKVIILDKNKKAVYKNGITNK